MPNLQALLDQIDRLDQQATKGPWTIDPSEGHAWAVGNSQDGFYVQSLEPDAEFIALARTFAPAAAKALRAVLELHQPYQYNGQGDRFCEGCSDIDWETSYPCQTVKAIIDAMEGDDA